MPHRHPHSRVLLATVLVTALFVAALAGVAGGVHFASPGLHGPHHDDRIGAHKGRHVESALGRRLIAPWAECAVGATPRLAVLPAGELQTISSHAHDWHKLAAGLVPLPLRI